MKNLRVNARGPADAGKRCKSGSILTSTASQAPVPNTGCRTDHDIGLRLEHFFHTGQNRFAWYGEFGAAMIDRHVVDRTQHPVRDIGRSGDLQEMAASGTRVKRQHKLRLREFMPFFAYKIHLSIGFCTNIDLTGKFFVYKIKT
jgi:hypothetical protein